VRDTGVGMAPEVAAKIFDRFFRADAGRGRVDGGAGLGLAGLLLAVGAARRGRPTPGRSS
jgi:two-component system OmpR family sensor kinase